MDTLLALVILATGLVSAASVFSVATSTNLRNQQRAAATLLVYDKMEQLQSADSAAAGGGLDPANPVTGFMEYVHLGDDGAVQIDSINSVPSYLRLWQVETTVPRTITVAVYGSFGRTLPLELARATGSW